VKYRGHLLAITVMSVRSIGTSAGPLGQFWMLSTTDMCLPLVPVLKSSSLVGNEASFDSLNTWHFAAYSSANCFMKMSCSAR
jgi:hypothetical protein